MALKHVLLDVLDVHKQVKVLDSYLCRVVHNPLLSSVVILAAVVFLHGAQLWRLTATRLFEFIFASDYVMDLVSNAINVLFLVRFSLRNKKGTCQKVRSSLAWEAALFAAQNVGCYVLVFHRDYSLLHSAINPFFKVFIVWQCACPYVILAMNVVELVRRDLDITEDVMRDFVVDANNNYLPIFIAHSYVLINFSFPFVVAGTAWVLVAYKLAAFSLKFYCIYQFILYEVTVVIYGITNVYNYMEMYTPVELQDREKGQTAYARSFFCRLYDDHRHWMMFAAMGVVSAFDVVYLGLGCVYGCS